MIVAPLIGPYDLGLSKDCGIRVIQPLRQSLRFDGPLRHSGNISFGRGLRDHDGRKKGLSSRIRQVAELVKDARAALVGM
jgi:hypothetical protein